MIRKSGFYAVFNFTQSDGQAPARNRLGNVIRGRQQRGRGGGRGGRRGNRNTRPPVTKDQLDAELAAYTAQVD